MSQEPNNFDKFYAALNPEDPDKAVRGPGVPEVQLGTKAYHDLGSVAASGEVTRSAWASASGSEASTLSPMERLRRMADELGDPEIGGNPALGSVETPEATKTEVSEPEMPAPADEALEPTEPEAFTPEQTAWQDLRPLSTRAHGAKLTTQGHGRPTAEPTDWGTPPEAPPGNVI